MSHFLPLPAASFLCAPVLTHGVKEETEAASRKGKLCMYASVCYLYLCVSLGASESGASCVLLGSLARDSRG